MLMQSHDGVIDLLPALPDVWTSGRVAGLRARGGFEVVELEWADRAVRRVVIRSTVGGNCRIRSSVPLCMKNGKPLQPATGENPNPLFRLPELQQVVVSPQASLVGIELPAKYVYDVETQPGRTYSFVLSEKNTGSEN